MNRDYDYIICGAGAAGLSLAVRLANTDKQVLILDNDRKNKNDRTFSFWANRPVYFQDIITKTWPKLLFNSDDHRIDLHMGDYKYNMIRGIAFYDHCKMIIEKSDNLHFRQEKVIELAESNVSVTVTTDQSTYTGLYAFRSYLDKKYDFSNNQFVIQHFLGYEVTCAPGTFDEDTAVFMDFNIPQEGETRFMYVLPRNDQEALIELAIFSNVIPDDYKYKTIINDYIEAHLKIGEYKIDAIEKGSIPMTDFKFNVNKKSRIVPIGTAAGAVKPSSGFAFDRIQRHCEAIIDSLNQGRNPNEAIDVFKYRFKKYDSVFLNAILTGKTTGKQAFTEMFLKSDAALMFKFLNEETHLFEEIKVFTGPPMLPFLKAFLDELL